MKIAVLSNVRTPTKADSPHGLGNSLHAIATGLARRGHQVTLFGGPGSDFDAGRLVMHTQEAFRLRENHFDALLDGSHDHNLSIEQPEWPVVNRVGDSECRWTPPRVVVATQFMQERYPAARIVPAGVDVDAIPFHEQGGEYLAFMGILHPLKGPHRAARVADMVQREVRFAGERTGVNAVPGKYVGVLSGAGRWEFLGGAFALLAPSVHDAAPRTPLEAAACGTPTLCLDGDGTQEHVEHCVSGFVCTDEDDMADALYDVRALDRRRVREWVAETHGLERMVDGYETALQDAAAGVEW